MQQEINSYKYWHDTGFHVLDNEIPHSLVLSQTYKEWLRENPKGVVS